jgi:Pro-kumamolisin, activation domain/Fibronectin type III domain/IPT/TIG domain
VSGTEGSKRRLRAWRRLGTAAAALPLVAFAISFSGGPASAAPAPAAPASAHVALVSVGAAPRIPVGDHALGPVPANAVLKAAISLKPRNDKAVTQFIAAVTNKNSPTYHDYLPAGQYRSRFGPTTATIDAVEAQLRSDGLHVSGVSANGLMVTFTGSTARIEAAFHTGLESYRLASGAKGTATTSAVRFPSTMARFVSGIVGLDNMATEQPQYIRPGSVSKKPAAAKTAKFTHPAGSPTPCTLATTDATGAGGLTDDQIAHAYGAFGEYSAGDFGQGQHIALFEQEPFEKSDIKTFDTCYFGSTAAAAMQNRLSVVPVDGGQLAGPGGGEALLDIEDVSAMAPQANIDVYEAPPTTYGTIDDYTQMVDNDTDQIISSSWALCEQLVQFAEPGIQEQENYDFQQAAAQGQTVFAAAGDTGDDSCNGQRFIEPPTGQNFLSLLDPASQPYVVSAGGTTINDATEPPAEAVWDDGAAWGAGGGGISESWAMPSWQQKVTDTTANQDDVTNAEAVESENASAEAPFNTPTFCDGSPGADLGAGVPCRETPDVSAQADEFTGAVTIYSASFVAEGIPTGWTTIGGTSSAAPIWAAMLALVNASASCAGNTVTFNEGGTPTKVPDVGFASPILYGIAGNPTAYAASFNDITAGNNDIYGLDNGLVFPARTGYDMASGLGSPQLTTPSGANQALAFYMCTYGAPLTAPPTVTKLTPSFGPTTAGDVITVTGSGFGTNSSPAVKSVQVGGGSTTTFSVTNNTTMTVTLPAADTTIPGNSVNPTQDGAGSAQIIVTGTDGESSAPSADSLFEFVDEKSATAVPSVTGVSPYGGIDSSPSTTPITVFGSGFSTTPADNTVKFGGIAATVQTATPFELTVIPPAFGTGSGDVTASACDAWDTGTGDNPLSPTADICQAEVTVTVGGQTSATVQPLPPYEGAFTFNNLGGLILPPGCGCEDEPQTDEYDYIPAPTLTGTSTTMSVPASLASEFGGTTSNLVEVTGTGMDPMTSSYAELVSPPGSAPNENSELFPIQESGSSMILDVPGTVGAQGPSVGPEDWGVGLSTLAGNSSTTAEVIYAGIPTVTSVVNNATGLPGVPDAPACASPPPAGGCGTPITITGQGFDQVFGPIGIVDNISGISLGTQYTYNVASDTQIATQAVQQLPAVADVEVCTETGCSFNPPDDLLYIYPPGNPSISGISAKSGPAHGSNTLTITGTNLGCAFQVHFGSVASPSVANAPSFLDCGQTGSVVAVAPPGKVGSVKVTIVTLESFFTGVTSNSVTYTYKASTPSAPQSIKATAGVGKATVTWKPPASNGGFAVTGYIVKATAKGQKTITIALGATAKKVTFSGLKAHVKWTFVVEAKNKLGIGLPGASNTVKPT